MSSYTVEPAHTVFEEKGDIILVPFNDDPRSFNVVPSLVHSPCPYLNEDLKCDVYTARPIMCSGFPFHLNDAQKQVNYDCLRGRHFSTKQKAFAKKLGKVNSPEIPRTLETLHIGPVTVPESSPLDVEMFGGMEYFTQRCIYVI